jgi:hypothetical protein
MSKSRAGSYDPRTFKALTFHDATARFRDGADSPRAYLERCLQTIAEREPDVKAFAALNEATARAAADASAARWKAGRQLSAIDGMPVGIKDLLETKEMPTGLGCAAYRDNFPKRDNAAVWALRQAGGPAVLRWWMPGWVRALAVSMLSMDEPDHTRLRSIVDEAFRRRAILGMEPRIFAIADELAADLFSHGAPADLVDRYARRLPLSVICELLGLPAGDRARWRAHQQPGDGGDGVPAAGCRLGNHRTPDQRLGL